MAKAVVVDDSKFMRNIIRDMLESSGHKIIAEADNGSDGIDAYREHKPDFITMDITMGGKDGMRAVEEIRKLDPGAKIIVISALNEDLIKAKNNDLNPDYFITKPFEKETLVSTVEKILAR